MMTNSTPIVLSCEVGVTTDDDYDLAILRLSKHHNTMDGADHAWALDAFRCCNQRLNNMMPWLKLPNNYQACERERETQSALFELFRSHRGRQV